MGNGLHVFDVIFEADKIAEAEEGKHFDGGFLFADEFGLDLLEPDIVGDVNDLGTQCTGEAASTKARMDEDADAANVALPSAELLVKGDAAEDFSVVEGEQGQVAAEVNILAPVADDLGFGNAVFDEHAFGSRYAEEEIMEGALVVVVERANLAARSVLKPDFFWKSLENKFE